MNSIQHIEFSRYDVGMALLHKGAPFVRQHIQFTNKTQLQHHLTTQRQTFLLNPHTCRGVSQNLPTQPQENTQDMPIGKDGKLTGKTNGERWKWQLTRKHYKYQNMHAAMVERHKQKELEIDDSTTDVVKAEMSSALAEIKRIENRAAIEKYINESKIMQQEKKETVQFFQIWAALLVFLVLMVVRDKFFNGRTKWENQTEKSFMDGGVWTSDITDLSASREKMDTLEKNSIL